MRISELAAGAGLALALAALALLAFLVHLALRTRRAYWVPYDESPQDLVILPPELALERLVTEAEGGQGQADRRPPPAALSVLGRQVAGRLQLQLGAAVGGVTPSDVFACAAPRRKAPEGGHRSVTLTGRRVAGALQRRAAAACGLGPQP